MLAQQDVREHGKNFADFLFLNCHRPVFDCRRCDRYHGGFFPPYCAATFVRTPPPLAERVRGVRGIQQAFKISTACQVGVRARPGSAREAIGHSSPLHCIRISCNHFMIRWEEFL